MRRPRCAAPGCGCACHRAVARQVPRLWLPGMDRALRGAIARGETVRAIAASLRLTEDSVRWRVKQLDLSLRDGWRSRQEVARVLGVSRRQVAAWISDGLLVAAPHGRRWWRVTDDDLAAFVRTYGDLLDPDAIGDRRLAQFAQVANAVNGRKGV